MEEILYNFGLKNVFLVIIYNLDTIKGKLASISACVAPNKISKDKREWSTGKQTLIVQISQRAILAKIQRTLEIGQRKREIWAKNMNRWFMKKEIKIFKHMRKMRYNFQQKIQTFDNMLVRVWEKVNSQLLLVGV